MGAVFSEAHEEVLAARGVGIEGDQKPPCGTMD
jgi:hypothetical protein